MATCSRAAMMSSFCGVVVMHLKDLWTIFFRILPKLLGFPANLVKNFEKDEYFHSPLMELETVVGTLPELPQDVLMNIFATLDVPDLLRAGSVCSSWHSAYTCLRDLGKYKLDQTPCLLYTSKSAGENVACLYSLVENRAYKLTLPEPLIRSRSLIGSSNGWLITADEMSELHLVNPITGEQIALPSVTTIEHAKPIFDESGIIHKYELSYHTAEEVYGAPSVHALNNLREHLYFKAFVFPDPSTGSYIAVLIHKPFFQLSFARSGDEKWTWLPQSTGYSDCVCMDGLLYALKSVGEIDIFDLTVSTITMKVIIGKLKWGIYESMYIARAPWGDLLQVWRTVDAPEGEDEDVPEGQDEDGDAPKKCLACTLKIQVYKVDMEAKELVEIDSLPYHMLFLGRNNSLCLSAEGHPKLNSNHAYFTDDLDEITTQLNNYTRDIGVWDLENGSKKKIVSQIWSNWPCPTWITPNLTMLNSAFSR